MSLLLDHFQKKEALAEFHEGVGPIGGYDSEDIEKNTPYTTPKAEKLDVMVLNFNKPLDASDSYLKEMDTLGVRSLTNEEFIQYCLKYANSFKGDEAYIALGSGEYSIDGKPRFLILITNHEGQHALTDMPVRIDYHEEGCRFPVVRK